MVDKVAVTLHVTPEERQKIEDLARERGYKYPENPGRVNLIITLHA